MSGGILEKEKQRNAPIQYSVIRVNVEVNVWITRTVSNPFSLYYLWLYGVEGWPRNGFLMYYTKGVAIGTEVSVRYKESGRFSGVVVKRGSTVVGIP